MSSYIKPKDNTRFNKSDFDFQDANVSYKTFHNSQNPPQPTSLNDVGFVYRSSASGYSFDEITSPYIRTYYTDMPLLNEGTYIINVTLRIAHNTGESILRSLEITDDTVTVDTFAYSHSHKSHNFTAGGILFMNTSKHIQVNRGTTNQQNITLRLTGITVAATINTYVTITRIA